MLLVQRHCAPHQVLPRTRLRLLDPRVELGRAADARADAEDRLSDNVLEPHAVIDVGRAIVLEGVDQQRGFEPVHERDRALVDQPIGAREELIVVLFEAQQVGAAQLVFVLLPVARRLDGHPVTGGLHASPPGCKVGFDLGAQRLQLAAAFGIAHAVDGVHTHEDQIKRIATPVPFGHQIAGLELATSRRLGYALNVGPSLRERIRILLRALGAALLLEVDVPVDVVLHALLQSLLHALDRMQRRDLQFALLPVLLDAPGGVVAHPVEFVRDADRVPQRQHVRLVVLAAGLKPTCVHMCRHVRCGAGSREPRIACAHALELGGVVAAVLVADRASRRVVRPIHRQTLRRVLDHALERGLIDDLPVAVLGTVGHGRRMDGLHARVAQLAVAGVLGDGLVAPLVLAEGDPCGAALVRLLDDQIVHLRVVLAVTCAAENPGREGFGLAG